MVAVALVVAVGQVVVVAVGRVVVEAVVEGQVKVGRSSLRGRTQVAKVVHSPTRAKRRLDAWWVETGLGTLVNAVTQAVTRFAHPRCLSDHTGM